MKAIQPEATLEELRRLPHETECVEFKEARTSFDFRKLGKYFSALSNEANLKNQTCGWLVFGIVNKDRSICGSQFRLNPVDLDSLKHEIAKQTGGTTFRAIHVVTTLMGRVVMFEIPAAPPGMPIAFQNHWYGRDGESLSGLSISELETIRGQIRQSDWSAEICPAATFSDLEPLALAQAKRNFQSKSATKSFAPEIPSWTDSVFLDRARFTIQGKITRAALLLLGRAESVHHLSPAVAQITWKLEGDLRAYVHFCPPFLLTTTELYAQIRNTVQKIDVPGRLVPYEVPQYDKWVILESLHNAIAHQDYTRQSRILVTEKPDFLSIENAGRFIEGGVSDYALGEKTPSRYRNRFLVDAMVSVNMIDSMGYGIHKMFLEQRKRFYPMPDYTLEEPDKVLVRIPGKIIDPGYTALLMQKHDLSLDRIILLDRVQKRLPIEKENVVRLRREKLIEGRFPTLFVASRFAATSSEKSQYLRNRAFDDKHYKKMIMDFIRHYGHATKKDLDTLLMGKLSDVLTESQKLNKIRNLRYALVVEGTIRNLGNKRSPKYALGENLAMEEDI